MVEQWPLELPELMNENELMKGKQGEWHSEWSEVMKPLQARSVNGVKGHSATTRNESINLSLFLHSPNGMK